MSLSNILSPPIKEWANVYLNDVECNTINGVPASTGQLSKVLFRSGTVSNGNMVATWAEVVDILDTNHGLVDVYFDNTIQTCEIDISYDFKGRCSFYSSLMNGTDVQVTLLDGVILTNLRKISGSMILEVDNVSGDPQLEFTESDIFGIENGAVLTNINGTGPAIRITALLNFLQITCNEGTIQTNATYPIIRVGSACALELDLLNTSNASNDIASADDITSLFYLNFDSNSSSGNQLSFNGVVVNPLDSAYYVKYNDDVDLPQYGATDVQNVLDILKVNVNAGVYTPNYTVSANATFVSSASDPIYSRVYGIVNFTGSLIVTPLNGASSFDVAVDLPPNTETNNLHLTCVGGGGTTTNTVIVSGIQESTPTRVIILFDALRGQTFTANNVSLQWSATVLNTI